VFVNSLTIDACQQVKNGWIAGRALTPARENEEDDAYEGGGISYHLAGVLVLDKGVFA